DEVAELGRAGRAQVGGPVHARLRRRVGARLAGEAAGRGVERDEGAEGAAARAAADGRREAGEAEQPPGVHERDVLGVVVGDETAQAAGEVVEEPLAEVHVDGERVDELGQQVRVRVDLGAAQARQRARELDLRDQGEVVVALAVVLHGHVVEEAELAEVAPGQPALARDAPPLALVGQQRDDEVAARQRLPAQDDALGDGVAPHPEILRPSASRARLGAAQAVFVLRAFVRRVAPFTVRVLLVAFFPPVAFLAVPDRAAPLPLAAFFAPAPRPRLAPAPPFAAAAAARASRSARACSSVTSSGETSFGSDAFSLPRLTYGP